MKDIEQMNHSRIKEYYNSVDSKTYRSLGYFKSRENEVSKLLHDFIGKSVLDIGAGDGYWLKYFIDKIDFYTAIEKGSENCRLIEKNFSCYERKIQILNIDAFQFNYENIDADTLFFAFFISHFSFSSIIDLIQKINQNINLNKVLILDSFWSEYRKNKFIDNNLEFRKRIVNESGNTIEVPKRFISEENLQELSFIMKMKLGIKYLDEYWCLALLTK